MKNLITGITGQDGLFLTNYLLKENQEVYGISRSNKHSNFFSNLQSLNKQNDVSVHIFNVDLTKQNEVYKLINDLNPDFIYNFSGPSSVYESFLNPKKTQYEIDTIFNNLISACKKNKQFPNFFQASSSEMFAKSDSPLSEKSEFLPDSPYAIAKYNIHRNISELRSKYDWNINSGIMFNHESEFRGDEYLIMKIINKVKEIKEGKNTSLTVGSLEIVRDWSYAGDFTEAIYQITNDDYSDDFVIGSGVGTKIKDLVKLVFNYFELEYENYTNVDKKLLRKNSPQSIIADPKKIYDKFEWRTETNMEQTVNKCIKFKLGI